MKERLPMIIELRKLRIAKSLSQETTAYTAEIWIDGERAFRASNHGTGGCDFFEPVGRFTVRDVEAWLLGNRKPRAFNGLSLDHDPEMEVACLIERSEARATLLRRLRTNVLIIEHDQVFSYPVKGRDRTKLAAALLEREPTRVLVDPTAPAAMERAINLLIPSDDAVG